MNRDTDSIDQRVKASLGINTRTEYLQWTPEQKAIELLRPVAEHYFNVIDLAREDIETNLRKIGKCIDKVEEALSEAKTEWEAECGANPAYNNALPNMNKIIRYGQRVWVPDARKEVKELAEEMPIWFHFGNVRPGYRS